MGIIQLYFIIILIFKVHERFFGGSNNSRIVPNDMQKFPTTSDGKFFLLGIIANYWALFDHCDIER